MGFLPDELLLYSQQAWKQLKCWTCPVPVNISVSLSNTKYYISIYMPIF